MLPLPPELTNTIDGMIEAEADYPLSVAWAIQRARYIHPDFAASDEELTKYIAARAARLGNAIEFDVLEQARRQLKGIDEQPKF